MFGPGRPAAWFEDAPPGGTGFTLGLGHRRLAIIDLSPLGRQPMQFGDLVITFNGEIYNYLELARELSALGHSFVSRSDTEVLLHAYAQWGTACVERLNGIFAFAIFDQRSRRLVMVRDRLGVKPLYYTADSGELIACSEIKGILALRSGRAAADDVAVFDFVSRGRLNHEPRTFFSGIYRLPAGCVAVWADGRLDITRYWTPQIHALAGVSFEDSAGRFGELFRDAVRLQMRADVSVGACLSGGLDSSSVVSVASRLSDRPMKTFTARFTDASMDEWRYAEAVHAATGAEGNQTWIEPSEFWSNFDSLVEAQEEPFAGPTVFAQWCLMRAIHASGIKVVLDGQGGDELLCGYAKYFYLSVFEQLRAGRLFSGSLALLAGLLGGGSQLRELRSGRRYLPRALSWLLPSAGCLNREFEERFHDRDVGDRAGDVASQQLLDISRFSLPALLRYEDKNSMAHSIEARVPFLDHRLVEWALATPDEHKVRGADSKRVLRAAIGGTVPEMVLRRTSKLGFGGTYGSWVGFLQPQLREWVSQPRLAIERFVDRSRLRPMVERHDPAVFPLVVLDRWMEHFHLQ
jgi:asparagine synthase (glutamine-hydrolysing)